MGKTLAGILLLIVLALAPVAVSRFGFAGEVWLWHVGFLVCWRSSWENIYTALVLFRVVCWALLWPVCFVRFVYFSFLGSLSIVVESLWYCLLVTNTPAAGYQSAAAFWSPASDHLVFSVGNVVNGILLCFLRNWMLLIGLLLCSDKHKIRTLSFKV